MSYRVAQMRRFARQYKKLHDNIATDVDATVETVAGNPANGRRVIMPRVGAKVST
jgi:mRNA-degrading endonuclease RelE of RelBE toxin-antitoxin system